MTDNGLDIEAFHADVKRRVDQRLDELLPKADRYPSTIHECMRYSVINGGKRIRPTLMAAVARALGRDFETVLSAACATEMIHVCSLILDDLPSMDNAETRHGRPANHLVYGEATATLASIALLNQALGILSESCTDRDGSRAAVIGEMVRTVGTSGMIAGQVVDLGATGEKIDDDTLEFVESHKTGALIVGAVRIAAILSGANPKQLNALTICSRNLGVAYQICDDILNVTKSPEDLGKLSHRDESAVNYAAARGIDQSREVLERFTKNAVAALDIFDESAEPLREISRYLAGRAL